MADVMEHFNDPFKVLSQINKLLNENGKLILTTFNIDSCMPKLLVRITIGLFHFIWFTFQTRL